mgnify:FL=1
MKNAFFLIVVLALITLDTSAQFKKYIVRFKDKSGTPFAINNPSAFLSSRAILRRTRENISIDGTDLPITPRYIDSVRLSGNVTILNKSKWLNQVCIQTTDSAALLKISNMPFVIAAQPLRQPARIEAPVNNKFNEETNSIDGAQSVSNILGFYN